MALAAKIKAAGPDVAGIAYNVHDWPDVWLFHAMITAGRRHRLDGDTVPLGGPDVGVKALQTFRRFVTEGGMPLIDWDQSRQQFIAGKIGIFFDTPARLRQVTDLIGDKFTLRTGDLPDRRQGEGRPADRRQRGDHHDARPEEAEGGVGVPQVRHGTGSAEDRRRRHGLPADQPARDGTGVPRPVLRQEPELPHRLAADGPRGAVAGLSGRQLGAHLARAARDHQPVMRGMETPEAGLERMVKESNALMKA